MAEGFDAATNGGMPTMASRKRWGATKASCMLALLLAGRVAIAQNVPPVQTASALPTSENHPAGPPRISYVGGQLRIDALGSTLAEVLTKVAAVTGVTIDVPAGASAEKMPIVELGPAPARQVLASLLSDTSFDYVIQASDKDPEKIQNVMVMAREKKGSGPTVADARPARGPYGRAGSPAKPEEAPAPDNPVPVQPEIAAGAEAASLNPQPPATPPDQAVPQPDPSTPRQDQSMQPPLAPGVVQTNVPKTFPVPIPPVLDQQNISQTLQQMYQQRVQMGQQNQNLPPMTPPGGK